jgi:hypothetical protein
LPDEAFGVVDVVGFGAALLLLPLEADALGVAVLFTATLLELGLVAGVELGVGVTEWELGVDDEDSEVLVVVVKVAVLDVVTTAL